MEEDRLMLQSGALVAWLLAKGSASAAQLCVRPDGFAAGQLDVGPHFPNAQNMDTSEKIVTQLRWIKWLIALLTLSFAAIAGSIYWATLELSSKIAQTSQSDEFTDRVSSLLKEGKETEVLKLCDEQEKKTPKDVYVHWYRGKAYYQLGKFAEALTAIQLAEDLAPSWRTETTGPYIEAINEKLAKKR